MFPKKCVCVYMYMTHIYMTRDEIQGMNEKKNGVTSWEAGSFGESIDHRVINRFA